LFSLSNHKYWLFGSVVICFALLCLFASVVYGGILTIQNVSIPLDEKMRAKGSETSIEVVDMQYSLQSINSAKVFFVKKEQAKQTIQAKKTQLKLTLDGIVAADESGMSRAIIRTNNKKPITYGVGEKIEGTNATLDSVEEIRVLIERAGVLESLELNRQIIER
jgi:type II secretion system protein C